MKSRLSKESYFMAWQKSLIFHWVRYSMSSIQGELVIPQDHSPCELLGYISKKENHRTKIHNMEALKIQHAYTK